MKKGLAILFTFTIILSGVHLSIATHFCAGKIAAREVSLSGKLATCGMEGSASTNPFEGTRLNSHCCEDQRTIIGITANFTGPLSYFSENSFDSHQINYFPVNQSFQSLSVSKNLYTNYNPPGKFSASTVDLDEICVIRI
jgi:hypothetical protein